jgi:hypothetical protein
VTLAGRRHRLTRLTSAPFQVQAPGPVSGQLSRTRPGESQMSSQFPVAFRPPAFASWASCSRCGISFPHRRPTDPRHRAPDRIGVSTFPTHETRPDRVPPLPRDGGAPRPTVNHRPPPAASQRPVLHPGNTSIHPGLNITGHQGIHSRSPQPVFPSPVTPGWNGCPWASSLSFAPRRHQRRTSGRGRAFEHSPGTTPPTSSVDPPICVSTHCVRPRVALR